MPTSNPTGSPTSLPTSGPTFGPSYGPTSGPTASPTYSPTAGPTFAPTYAPTAGPTSGPTLDDGLGGCYDGPVVVSGCDTSLVPIESPTFVEGEYVQIKGVFFPGVERLEIKYPGLPASVGELTRTLYDSQDAAEEIIFSECTNGLSEVKVVVTKGGVDCEHVVAVPCKAEGICGSPTSGPTSEPSTPPTFGPTSAPTSGSLSCDSIPFTITDISDESNPNSIDPFNAYASIGGVNEVSESEVVKITSCGDGKINLQFKQLWRNSGLSWWLSMNDIDDNYDCPGKAADKSFEDVINHEAVCTSGQATVLLAARSNKFAQSNSRGPTKQDGSLACSQSFWTNNDPTKIMLFKFVFDCDGIDRRRMDEELFGLVTDGEPIEDMEAVAYCVSEDFPCGEEGEELVNVCHYSARKGYKTYCISEGDSDLLRYYADDYCGPCVESFGTK